MRSSDGGVFNNAAQVWNHTFYWNCLAPNAGGEPQGELAAAIAKSFGSFADFKAKFTDAAVKNFGAGWTWLVKNADGSGHCLHQQRRYAADQRRDSAADRGCLGTRLLHRLP